MIEWRNVAGSEAAIRYRGNVVSIEDLRLANGDQTLDVSGAMAVDVANTALTPDVTGATASLEVHARNLDLAQAEKLALQDRGLSGRLTADATITGSLRQPKVAGKVQITDGGFRAYKFQSLIADVGHAGNRITLDATLQQAPGIAITARGTVPDNRVPDRDGRTRRRNTGGRHRRPGADGGARISASFRDSRLPSRKSGARSRLT